MKEKSKKKVFLKVLFIIIGLIVVYNIILYIFVPSTRIDCDDSSFGDGWFCDYSSELRMWIPIVKRIELEIKCKMDGGKGSVGGQSGQMGGEYFKCVVPFSDYGDICSGSSDCMGNCEYVEDIPEYCTKTGDTYYCTKDISGTCSEEKYDMCDIWKEVEDSNTIISHSEVCIFE